MTDFAPPLLYNLPMDVIYIDSLFFLNFIIDYLLLLCSGKICSIPLHRGRLALGALWGGIYAVLAIIFPTQLTGAVIKILSGAVAVLIAYWPHGTFFRTVPVFFAVSAAFAGAIYAVSALGGYPLSSRPFVPVSMRVLLLSFAGCYALLTLLFRGSGKRLDREICAVTVRFSGRQVELTALRDTGKELTDPIGGRDVLIAGLDALAPLFSREDAGLMSLPPPDAFAALSRGELRGRLSLLSCSCLASDDVLLLAFRPDEVRVNGAKLNALVAVTTAALSADGDYQALI